MRFLTLAIQNFGAFRGRHELNLDRRGLVAVVGVNGAGKSTILDALLWGLTGETGPRKETSSSDKGLAADDVVNEIEGKDCLVELTFETAHDTRWHVRRWRKGSAKPSNGVQLSRLDLFGADGPAWVVEGDLDADEVQRKIWNATKLDRQLVEQVLVRSQEDIYNFTQATPRERFEIFSRIENLGPLDEVGARAAARVTSLASQISAAKARADAADARVTSARERLRRTEEQAAQFEAGRAARVSFAESQLAAARVREDAERSALDAARLACIPRDAIAAQIADVDRRYAEAAPSPPPTDVVTQWRGYISTLQVEQAKRTARADAARKSLERLRRVPDVCGECGQRVDPAHVAAKAAEYEAAVAEGAHVDPRIAEAQASLADVESGYARYRAEAEAARAPLLQERGRYVADLATVDKLHAAVVQAEAAHRRALAEVDVRVADVQRATAEANPHASHMGRDAAEIDDALKVAESERAAAASFEVEAGLHEWWRKNIPVLKAWLFDNVVGEITKSANRWLRVLMGGRAWVQVEAQAMTKAGEMRDKIAVRCFEWRPDGSFVERAFRKWSGGEKRRISIALEWALAERLSQRSDVKCSFLALDEVDRALDVEGREGLRAALLELAQERETILCVSHSETFRVPASLIWRVGRDPLGGPRIVEEDPKQKALADAAGLLSLTGGARGSVGEEGKEDEAEEGKVVPSPRAEARRGRSPSKGRRNPVSRSRGP